MASNQERIAVIFPLELELSGRLLDGAMEYAKTHRRVRLVELPYRGDTPNSLHFDGDIPFDAALVGATKRALWMKTLISKRIPIIAASGDWADEKVPSIYFDGTSIVRAAVEHLSRRLPAALAHIEFVIDGYPLAEGRNHHFRKHAKQRGIPVFRHQIFSSGDWSDSALAHQSPIAGEAAESLRDFLRSLPKPAGIWCVDDLLGLRVCEAADDLGLRIPADLAVLGLGDLRGAAYGPPPLSTIPLPGDVLGYRALEALDACLRGASPLEERLSIEPPPVIERESTAGVADRDPVSKALALIAERAASGMTAREVAAAVRLSPQTLHARIVERIGRTPGEEIRRIRLATARGLLSDPRLSIAQVAQRCGFGQQSKFSNFFRRETGLSPRDFRKQ